MAVPAEQFPAVASAEQEDETVQVLPQLRGAVGRGCRRNRLARRRGSRASQPERNCGSSASSAASLAFSLTSGIGLPPSAVGRVGHVTVDLAAGARDATATVSPSMTSRKVSSPARTVTVLPAWIMPTWIFWRVTWMPRREETRRCTAMGPAGRDERAAARRAPRSPSRPAGGTAGASCAAASQRGQRRPSGCRPCAA